MKDTPVAPVVDVSTATSSVKGRKQPVQRRGLRIIDGEASEAEARSIPQP